MSTYAIGDIQGCYRDFKKLLKQMNFNKKKDTLWLAGDLVNKGPNSLDVIKYIMDLDTKAISVLGNHDFYLIASYFQAKTWPNKNKNFEEILSDKDSNEIIKWLRQQKLVYKDPELEYILVHAGIYPKWDLKDTFLMASNIEKLLKSKNCKAFVETLWSGRRGGRSAGSWGRSWQKRRHNTGRTPDHQPVFARRPPPGTALPRRQASEALRWRKSALRDVKRLRQQ